jgi:glucosamine--fructose-6-phosphate aminotransferase (isomerizing)
MTVETPAAAGPSLMLRETAEAPDVVARQIEANAAATAELGDRLREAAPAFVVTCARGSSDSAATYAKYLIEIVLGTVVASVGPSVSSVYGRRPNMKGALFIAISQSGRSPDLLTLAEAARADGALTVALVNDTTSPLADLCEVVLPLHAGPERSVAATKSYIASLSAVLQLVAAWSAEPALDRAVRRLPDYLDGALKRSWLAAAPLLQSVAGLYVVGRGPGYAAALEAALKLKETAGLHAEAGSSAELRHGPMAIAGPDFPVLMFSQNDAALPGLADLGAELAARGVPVIAAGPADVPGAMRLAAGEGVDPFAQPIALIQSFYPLAEAVARGRGRDPDRPPHLRKVTETL